MGDYRSLEVWKRAHQLTLQVYQLTTSFPRAEIYGLTSQLRRAAAAIPANLAEGTGRNTRGELVRYCRIGLGSANELEYHLLLSRDLGYLEPELHSVVAEEVDHLKRMLSRFVRRLGSTDSG